MKKFILLISAIFLLTGCGQNSVSKPQGSSEPKPQILKCTMHNTDKTTGYTKEAVYNVTYLNEMVESVKIRETVYTDSNTLLNFFNESLEETYSKQKQKYGGYEYKVTKLNNHITYNITIDYNVIDLDKLVKDEPILKDYVINNKLKADGLEALYKSWGAAC